jgi:hypothetical protein
MSGSARSPYLGLPAHQVWRRAVVAAPEIDPQHGARFTIARADRVGTAGSCFAQRIAERLREAGFRYYVVEPGSPWASEAERAAAHYGEYSARYGNVYTTLQLQQLFERAYGRFVPAEPAWRIGERFADPFRPRIEPGGFASESAMLADRAAHLNAVRHLFETLDVFVFTLGLTETWCTREDGAALPVCPGIDVGVFDGARYAFRNLGVDENRAALGAFVEGLHAVNPGARIVLTLSPVPLAATVEDRHVVQATAYSKAVLRVVAEEMRARYPFVDYFGSYEMVTATFQNDAFFEADRRNVTDAAVDRVMRSFFRHFTAGAAPAAEPFAEPQPAAPAAAVLPDACDEELLAAQIAREVERRAARP